uniref:Uncharacterized protein n=1 Tax=Rhizophora mucronata TaxID=61149 RepID=A0A2P2M1U3_RHIMU
MNDLLTVTRFLLDFMVAFC